MTRSNQRHFDGWLNTNENYLHILFFEEIVMGDEKWIFYIEYKKLLKKAKNTADYTKDSVLHLKK